MNRWQPGHVAGWVAGSRGVGSGVVQRALLQRSRAAAVQRPPRVLAAALGESFEKRVGSAILVPAAARW